jgi:hypothetical protein
VYLTKKVVELEFTHDRPSGSQVGRGKDRSRRWPVAPHGKQGSCDDRPSSEDEGVELDSGFKLEELFEGTLDDDALSETDWFPVK